MKKLQAGREAERAGGAAAEPSGLAFYDGGFKVDDHLPYRLAQTQLLVHRAVASHTHPDLVAIQRLTQRDVRILGMVGQHGRISPSRLAQRTGLDRATVTRTLALLMKRNMIVEMRNAEDGRSKLVGLSELGVTYCGALFPIMQDYGEFLEEVLAPGEKELLLKALKKLREQAARRIES
ncbi:MAG: MarR family transcriptional regulator [Xanthomonadales bacterium]|nr:MarR family transcriptional regulator [Xanthomonadales bacterium]